MVEVCRSRVSNWLNSKDKDAKEKVSEPELCNEERSDGFRNLYLYHGER